MGNRDRTAAPDLLFEERNDGARRFQYIAKPHHAQPDTIRATVIRLQNELSQALGRAHHAGRTDRFVGRDQDEGLNAGVHRSPGSMQGAKHIVEYALEKILLNDRYMLVSGGMVNRLNSKGLHDFANSSFVMHRTEKRYDFTFVPQFPGNTR